jgi:sec-independent protein translocase protein TatA
MGPEWWIVLGVIVLIFGGSQLPKLARSLGQAQKEFKKGISDSDDEKEGEKPASS